MAVQVSKTLRSCGILYYMLPEKLNSEMDKRYIDQQLVALEDRNLEFKAATNQFDRRKAAKYAVAIANNGGGAMFFGISDEVPRDVVGTQAFGDLAEAELWLTNAVKFKVEFSEYRYEGKRVVRLSIPGRMRGVPFEYEGQFLTRTGESLTPMTSTELKAIFQETQLPYEEEDASVTMVVGEILQALDVETLGALTKSRFPVEEAAIARELHQCRMIRPSTIPGEWVILKLGALLLAKDLNDFRLHGHQLRIIEYSGTGRQSAKFDKFFEAGYAKALPAALDFLSVVLPRHEDFSAATREDVPIYPNIALRELIANALVHQDFWETAGGNYPTVEIFADRVEISNGGIPLLDVRKFVTEVAQRNRALADMMRRLGLAENRGSGVDRSLQAMEEIHGAAPDFRSETKMTRVILRGNKRWEQLGPEERQWAAYMHCCLKWANGEFMTNASLRQRFGLPDSKVQHASTLIKELVNQKVIIIDPQGPQGNKTRRYVPFS